MLTRLVVALGALVMLAAPITAQRGAGGAGGGGGSGGLPLVPTRPLKFTTDEGT